MTQKKLNDGITQDLADTYQKEAEEAAAYKKECAEFWDQMTALDRLKAFYSVMTRLSQGELRDKSGYRGILYDTFGFCPEAYGVGMECGFMELHNAIYDKSDLEAWAKRNGYVKEPKND